VFSLTLLGLAAGQPIVYIALLAAVPMFAAMFTGVVKTGIVAAAAFAAACVTSVVTQGQAFADAVPALIGVIIGAAAAVIATQVKPDAGRAPRGDGTSARAEGQSASPVPVQSQGEVDALTGLPTRASTARTLLASSATGPRVVAFVGCDGVSAVNDEFGWAIGDEIIFAVAGRTRYALPPADTVARWDGDELLLVLGADAMSAGPTLVMLSEKVNRNPIRTASGLVPVTISLGAAVWLPGADFDDASERARKALHRAKSQGPAHVVMDEAAGDAASA
jgi:diguanylate cyclase (GGDEF)-like protein